MSSFHSDNLSPPINEGSQDAHILDEVESPELAKPEVPTPRCRENWHQLD